MNGHQWRSAGGQIALGSRHGGIGFHIAKAFGAHVIVRFVTKKATTTNALHGPCRGVWSVRHGGMTRGCDGVYSCGRGL